MIQSMVGVAQSVAYNGGYSTFAFVGNELYKQNAFVQILCSLLLEICYTVCVINVHVIEKEINV